jgi:molecular chaperone GrpE
MAKHNDEIEQQGEPREDHAAEEALHDEEALKTAEMARHGEDIAAVKDLSPRQRAKMLRKLDDAELIALAEQAAKADHWLDVARRAQAELDNTVKRLRREQQDASRFATSSLARDLLQVIDNLGRALEAGAKAEDFKSLNEGVQLTHKLFHDVLQRHSITAIEAVGQPFDPALHEALMTDSQPDVEDNVITAEFEKGWKLHDRVLRASKVRVNKR